VAATSDALLEHVTAAPEEAAIFLDFDGVLAPIVARPEDAYPPPETRVELERLAGRYPLVAVVSGRAGDDVRERVAVDGIVYVGSHGLELDRQADRWRQQIVDFSSAAAWPTDEIELKGLSVGGDPSKIILLQLKANAAQLNSYSTLASPGSCCLPMPRRALGTHQHRISLPPLIVKHAGVISPRARTKMIACRLSLCFRLLVE